MICECGGNLIRVEQPTKTGLRRITETCTYCFRRERELRSRSGLLLHWKRDKVAPASSGVAV
jgi:hypothetical protein